MPDKLSKNKFTKALHERVVKKLIEADLLVAAEAFGASLDEKQRASIDTITCFEKDFVQKVLKIAEISGDKLFAERAHQRIRYHGLKYELSPATLSALEIYSERFYSFWEDGKRSSVRSEISDFPQWFNTAMKKAEMTFIAHDMENILVMSCTKERAQRAPLLWKLLNNIIESETIRLGYVYPAREMAHKVLSDFFQRMKELLLIREQHDSSLQLGEHPEELIPYVSANIIKNLLNHNLSAALDNINALSYLHYAAQETESVTGTAAYEKLKKELVLFKEGRQYNWPNEIRKLFLDSTIVEALIRYRFTHGLIAVNTALAYRYAEKGEKTYLDPWEEDAIVLNGLILTKTGYLKSSGFNDTPIKEQFQRDVYYFKELKKVIGHQSVDRICSWQEEIKTAHEGLKKNILVSMKKINAMLEEKRKEIESKEDMVKRIELKKEKAIKSIFSKVRRNNANIYQYKTERLMDEIGKDKEDLKDLFEVGKIQGEIGSFLKKIARFFS